MSWGAPLSPNGQLEGYRVIYQHTAPVQGLHTHTRTGQGPGARGVKGDGGVDPVVAAGVSKVVTVDVRGSWQRWLRVRDLVRGATYTFSIQALTVNYGPAIRANLTAQPVKGQ